MVCINLSCSNKYSCFFSVLYLLIFSVNVSAIQGKEYKYEKWTDLEKEVIDTGFSREFIDSLYDTFSMDSQKSLRTFDCELISNNEKFVYEVGWGPLNAGFGIMDLNKDTESGDIQITFKGVTNKFVSAFYKLRDYFSATIDSSGLYPFFYEEHLREGKYRDKRWVLFDHVYKRVYTNKKGYEKVDIPRFTNDILSMIYIIRSQKLTPGKVFHLNCFLHKKVYPIKFKCTKIKKVKVKAGEFLCIGVEPGMVGNGRNFSWKDKLLIWFSYDKYYIPVKIKAKIKIGSLIGKLIYYKKYLYSVP